MTFPTDADRCKDEFIKTGMWPNEVMYQLWRKAWATALATAPAPGCVMLADDGRTPILVSPTTNAFGVSASDKKTFL